ncbi:acyl-CoA dehydrogenase family protein [Candidatus Phycosocius spiralis]|uniref:Acyl-CoA dehydrogenase n=1 Tax=Candidatus Phycosocius spiralis TaxID=2815099 RepID=A0ABQ4PS93_9PROT|nr:acyl-CoA dehydrogenase family protein [Candidatus Phycosocius spiralis]GIU65884.1 acyl-CoA dehydrogenase [Candidatus Phycosocius spiralis]
MAFDITEDQTLILQTARRFAQDKLAPHAMAWEEAGTLDKSILKAMAGLGFAGIYVSEDVGGSGLTRLDATLIFEELSRGDISHAAFLSIHNMASWMIDSFGTLAQRQKFLPALTCMDLVASYCLTEPDSGSDAASLSTTARLDGDVYVVNGTKAFISGAGFSDLYVVMVRTGQAGPQGISTLIIPKDTPGLSFGKAEKKMGWQAQPTAQVMFEDCRIPVTNRLGEEGHGFRFAMLGLDGGRLNIAACSLGGAGEALDRAMAYAKDRKQFGKSLWDFQATQFKLADMATELEVARVFLRYSAAALDAKSSNATKLCAMAKRFVTDVGFNVANQALQIHGGYGYLKDYEIERIVRDLRVHQILEGTNEIMRVIIARELDRGT